MTQGDAAYEILSERGTPMSYLEITNEAIERGLIKPGGPTPENSMNRALHDDRKKRFNPIGDGRFVLTTHRNTLHQTNGPRLDASHRRLRELLERYRQVQAELSSLNEELEGVLGTNEDDTP